MHTGFWRGNLTEIDFSEDQGVDEKMILKWKLNRIDWVDLAQDREKWQAVVNTVMNLRGGGGSIASCETVSQKQICPGVLI